jgi:hypothetical protein
MYMYLLFSDGNLSEVEDKNWSQTFSARNGHEFVKSVPVRQSGSPSASPSLATWPCSSRCCSSSSRAGIWRGWPAV